MTTRPVGTPVILRPPVFRDVPHVVAGFSTRQGGVSPPPYDSLNLGLSTADAEANVRENRRRFAEALDSTVDALAIAGQIHGDRVKVVSGPGCYPGVDALVTEAPGVVLGITAADCAAVLLVDPESRIVGACHAGWRGVAARIPVATVATMQKRGAVPGRLRAYVSPCISVEQFEVGLEVAARFDDAFVHSRPAWPRPHVDLKAAITAQLRSEGVLPGHVEVSPHCTATDTDRFFSYRAEQGATGRMMGVIGLRAAI